MSPAPLETVELPFSSREEKEHPSRVVADSARPSFLGALRSLERVLSRVSWPLGSRQPFRIHVNGDVIGVLDTCMTAVE